MLLLNVAVDESGPWETPFTKNWYWSAPLAVNVTASPLQIEVNVDAFKFKGIEWTTNVKLDGDDAQVPLNPFTDTTSPSSNVERV